MYRCIKQPIPVLHTGSDIRVCSEWIYVVHLQLIPDYQTTLNELFQFFSFKYKVPYIFSTSVKATRVS